MASPAEFIEQPISGVQVRRAAPTEKHIPLRSRLVNGVGHLWTDLVSIVSPARALQLTAARDAYLSRRGYDAADVSRLSEHRRFSRKDADSEINSKLSRIRALSREECRNNGFARSAKKARRNNVVGDSDVGQGITIDPAVQKPDGSADEEINRALKALWQLYRDTIDYRGFLGFVDLCAVADQELFESGEVLAVEHDIAPPGSDIPYSVEMLEADRLPTSAETFGLGPHGKWPVIGNDGQATANWVRHGIEYNENGQRVAYHIMQDHPGCEYAFASTLNTRRYPVERVIHYFETDRAEQTRGVPAMVAALPLLADLRDLGSWELVAAKMAACFGVVFRGGSVGNLPFPQNTNAVPPKDGAGNEVVEIQPGMAIQAGSNTDVSMFQGNRPGGTFLPFFNALARWASAAFGMSYSTVTKDYTGLSFSAMRQEAMEERRAFRALQGVHVRHLCRRVWRGFVRAAVRAGKLPQISQVAFAADSARYTRCDIQTPGWDYVNPYQEAAAEAIQVAHGFKTLDEVPNASGMEPSERLASLGRYKRLAADAGLSLAWAQGISKPPLNNKNLDDPDTEPTELDDLPEDEKTNDSYSPLAVDAIASGASEVQDTALNGAQVATLQQIVQAVANGELPGDAAQQMIFVAFPAVDKATVKIMIDAAKYFTPKSQSPGEQNSNA